MQLQLFQVVFSILPVLIFISNQNLYILFHFIISYHKTIQKIIRQITPTLIILNPQLYELLKKAPLFIDITMDI